MEQGWKKCLKVGTNWYLLIIIDSLIKSWFSPRIISMFLVIPLQSCIWFKSYFGERWGTVGFQVTLGSAKTLWSDLNQRALLALNGDLTFPALLGASVLLFLIVSYFFLSTYERIAFSFWGLSQSYRHVYVNFILMRLLVPGGHFIQWCPPGCRDLAYRPLMFILMNSCTAVGPVPTSTKLEVQPRCQAAHEGSFWPAWCSSFKLSCLLRQHQSY